MFNNPIDDINRRMKEQMRAIDEATEDIYRKKHEQTERAVRMVELSEQQVEQNDRMLKEVEKQSIFLKSMSEDAARIVTLINSLEEINKTNGYIVEANLALIQGLIEDLIRNNTNTPEKLYEVFLEEAKKQIVEKGVNYGLQFLITGMKALVSVET